MVATEALSRDGTSAALSDRGLLSPDRGLRESLTAAAARAADSGTIHSGTIVSTDLFYDVSEGEEEGWLRAGALAVDMETATLFALAARRGFRAASLLVVSDLLIPSRIRIEPGPLHASETRMGEVALSALISATG